MTDNKKVTVTQLSELTGVSRATISRVLNNNANVRPEVRKKVLAAIEETGYIKDRSSPGSRISSITLLGDDSTLLTSNHFYEPIIQTLKQETALHNIQLDFKINNSLKRPDSYEKILGSAEAVIVIGTDRLDLINAVCRRGVPAVMLNAIDPLMRLSSVMPDNEFGSFALTNHLIDKGHRKIKILTANIKHSTYQRTEGFLRALKMRGIHASYEDNVIDVAQLADKVDPSGVLKDDIFEGRIGFDFGISRFFDYLIEHDCFADTTAVFCICDVAAIGLINKFIECGISVPQDISVASFDDLSFSSLIEPPLTTINTHNQELARTAFNLLCDLINDKVKHPVKIYQQVELIERQSVRDLNAASTAPAADQESTSD